MIYDGDCGFCRLWIERLRATTGERVEYRASQEAAPEFPEIPPEAFERSVQFLDTDGTRCEGAAAVFRAWARGSRLGGGALWLHAKAPPFAWAAEAAYRAVARHRMLFSRLTRPPSFAIAAVIFLRLLGL